MGTHEDMLLLEAGEFTGRVLKCAAVGTAPGSPDFTAVRFVKQRNESFRIDRNVVSCAEFRACVQANACGESGGMCNDNGALVSLKSAHAYCAWRTARLPRYSEWQRASRGVDGRRTPTGENWSPGTCGDQWAACPVRSEEGFEYTVNGSEEWTGDIGCDDVDPARPMGPVRVSLWTPFLTEYRADFKDVALFRCAR